jgi:hypothetical protein
MSNDDAAAASTVTPSQQKTDCQDCLFSGLRDIGITSTTNGSVDFGAINSDDDCITLAHSIEACLDEKGYFVAPLSTGFVQLRAAGAVVPVPNIVDGLVTASHPK